jgi:hypothetical protein
MMSFWVEPRGSWFACCQAGTVQFHSYARYSDGRTEELTLLSDWKVYISGSRAEPQEVTVDGKGLVSVHDPCAFRDVTLRAKYGPEDRIAMLCCISNRVFRTASEY